MTNERLNTKQDIEGRPTIFLTLTPSGDVEYSTNNEEMDISTALFMMDMVRHKMLNSYIIQMTMEKQREKATSVITPVSPTIIRP